MSVPVIPRTRSHPDMEPFVEWAQATHHMTRGPMQIQVVAIDPRGNEVGMDRELIEVWAKDFADAVKFSTESYRTRWPWAGQFWVRMEGFGRIN